MKSPVTFLRTVFATAIIIVGSFQSYSQEKEQYPVLPENISTVEFESIDGTKFRLTDYKGKVVLVHLWATWAVPYLGLAPHLVELRNKYSDSELEIIGLNGGDAMGTVEERSMIEKYAKKNKINFLLGRISSDDVNNFCNLTNFDGIPQSIVIDREGRIRGIFLGAANQVTETMVSTVNAVIAEQ